jgi:hypothetical protein
MENCRAEKQHHKDRCGSQRGIIMIENKFLRSVSHGKEKSIRIRFMFMQFKGLVPRILSYGNKPDYIQTASSLNPSIPHLRWHLR